MVYQAYAGGIARICTTDVAFYTKRPPFKKEVSFIKMERKEKAML